ncbi:hypothetical protein BDV24DRAFT_160044 [Aspergillus arachidicola]|uniref:Uncharacterized protein n=1 Tax=Aspergillus arachidicola TaxID=656916 RepID=A0A5N6YHJ9_9EURO|nr:hypothetical protein BDV24DRAFT_160044 [Aspergillus arachidicola]
MESSRLEALLPEMKYAILLTIPDLASLNALVHASPIFHTLYLSRRKQLLSTVLNRCLQLPVMVEAVATLIALRGLEERRKNYRPFGILQFLHTYIPLRSNLDPTSSPSHTWSMYHEQDMDVYDTFTTFTENNLIEMARLHTIVEYCLGRHDISNGDRESFMLFGVGYLYRWIRVSRISCPEERLAEQIAMTRGRRGYLSGPMFYAFEEYPDREYHLDYGDEGTSGRIFVSDEDWNSPNLAWTWCLDPDTPDASIVYFTSAWKCTLRTWGYIFWDKDRLEEWDIGLQIVKEKVKDIWESIREMHERSARLMQDLLSATGAGT